VRMDDKRRCALVSSRVLSEKEKEKKRKKRENLMIIHWSSIRVYSYSEWYLSYSQYTYIYVMSDKLDKLFANVHNNEKAIGLIFYYWSMEMIRDSISWRTSMKNTWMYIDVHMDGIDHLDCIILSLFIFLHLQQ
jgi:hypothetical protein